MKAFVEDTRILGPASVCSTMSLSRAIVEVGTLTTDGECARCLRDAAQKQTATNTIFTPSHAAATVISIFAAPHQRYGKERLPFGPFCVRAPHTFRLCKGYFIEAHRAGPDKLGMGAASKAIKRLAHTRSQGIGRKARADRRNAEQDPADTGFGDLDGLLAHVRGWQATVWDGLMSLLYATYMKAADSYIEMFNTGARPNPRSRELRRRSKPIDLVQVTFSRKQRWSMQENQRLSRS